MKKNFRKVISTLLAVVMVFTLVPTNTYAKEVCEKHGRADEVNWLDYDENTIEYCAKGLCDINIKGKVLSNKKVKITWTKNKYADGYQVCLTGRAKWYHVGCYDKYSQEYLGGVKFDKKYTATKTINKNVNTVTISIPNAIGDTVTYTQYHNKDKHKEYQSLNNLFQVRYRMYKVINGKKIWTGWTMLQPIGNTSGSFYKAIHNGLVKSKKPANYNATVLNFNRYVWDEHFNATKLAKY